ncbi:hypothetical protein [Noviherbaspirillum massiliense]|uniref:hypothetical protein n=1 Tax=Noviherbaspirillum massiliense TaxID=1465823 RepID=UPI000318C35D|nr:hypothetical protein [Noviherbaspirillum massiliense]
MAAKASMGALALAVLIAGCASQKTTNQSGTADATPQAASEKTQPSTPGARIVKSRNGQFEGEIIGNPAPKSKFAKVQIGMTMREVNELIGTPNDMIRHETGKRWIPFYFGNDAQRLQTLYKGEGCLTYTGGNVFGGGGNELIRIAVDAKGTCFEE